MYVEYRPSLLPGRVSSPSMNLDSGSPIHRLYHFIDSGSQNPTAMKPHQNPQYTCVGGDVILFLWSLVPHPLADMQQHSFRHDRELPEYAQFYRYLAMV